MKRVAKDLLQSFQRNQQKSKVHCTFACILFSAQQSSLPGVRVITGIRRLARSPCRNRGLGMEMIPSNQAVLVEHVWTGRTEYRSELEPSSLQRSRLVIAHSFVFCSFIQRQPAPFPSGIMGLEQGQEGEGWPSQASLGTDFSLLAGITFGGDMNFFPYD